MSRVESPGDGSSHFANTSRKFPAVEELMPHRGRVILLGRVLSHSAQFTDALVSVDAQRWLRRDDGSVAGWLTIEYMAQCVAAREGLLSIDEGRPLPTGFLVGVTGLKLGTAEFRSGEELRVRSWRVRGRPELGALSHRCELYRFRGKVSQKSGEPGEIGDDATLAEGRLSVAVRPDAAE